MRFLHFSDIHYTGSEDQSKVIKAFCCDIKNMHSEEKFNALIFTGDLASKGATNSQQVQAIKVNVIDEIKKSIGDDIPFLICPGNHDVNLKNRNPMFNSIFEKIQSPSDANVLLESALDKSTEIVWAHLAGYTDIARYVDIDAYNNHPLFYTKTFSCDGKKIGFASFNCAWNTKGGGNIDYGNLFFGEKQIDLALKELADCDIRFAMLHHSLEWLAPSEKGIIQRALTTNFQAIFSGHNHDTNASSIKTNIGAAFFSNTGCIYETRDYFNGYSIINYDANSKSLKINAREYYSSRNVFDIAPRFAKDGEISFGSSTLDSTTTTSITISINIINICQEKASSKLLSYTASDVAPKKIGSIFVEPPLAVETESQYVAKEGVGSSQNLIAIRDLAVDNCTILIVGKRESGKTILLHEIAVNRFQDIRQSARLGFVVDLSNLPKMTEAAFLDSALEFLGGELRKKELIQLLEAGEVVICIDNLHQNTERQLDLIRSLQNRFEKSQFIISSQEEQIDDLTIEMLPDLGTKEIRRIYIHSFRRKQTKELVTKWFGETDAVSTQKLSIITQLFTRLNVPRTPFIISVLLWVIEQRPEAKLINQASAIEVLIEGLLEKFKESKARTEFDSTIKQHFLEEFANRLDLQKTEWMPSLEFDEFVVSYFRLKGLLVSTRGFAEELIRKGLIYESTDRVAFKFDCFRAYFLARRFANDSNLWKKAISAENVHRYVTELDLYTGLHRDNKEVLEAAHTLCTQLFVESGVAGTDLSYVNDLGKIPLLFNDEKVASFQNAILSEDKTLENNFLTEMDTPSDVSMNHDEGRKRNLLSPSSDLAKCFESLRAFSIILRNSELINDVELKRKCFNTALDYWGKLMIHGLKTSIEDFEKLKEQDLPSNFKGMSVNNTLSLLKIIIQSVITSMLSENLSTPKLQKFIQESSNQSDSVIRMFAIFLSIDNQNTDAYRNMQLFLKDHSKNTMLVQCIFFKLLALYMQKLTNGSNQTALRDCLSDAFTAFRGGGLREGSFMKAQFLQNLDKKLLTGGISE